MLSRIIQHITEENVDMLKSPIFFGLLSRGIRICCVERGNLDSKIDGHKIYNHVQFMLL